MPLWVLESTERRMGSSTGAVPRLGLRWYGRSSVGCVRANNEDNLCARGLLAENGPSSGTEDALEGTSGLDRPGVLLAVADGIGGERAGEVASGMAVSILAETLAQRAGRGNDAETAREDLHAALVAAVLLASERIRDEGASNPSRARMGTTLTAAWMLDDVAMLAHVGDSRAYLWRGGKLQQLTRDQTWAEKLLEDNIIGPDEVGRVAGRHILMQALGSDEDIEVAVSTVAVEDGDTMLFCTDGLSGVVPEDVLRDELHRGGQLEGLVDRLIHGAERRGGPDNITLLAARIAAL